MWTSVELQTDSFLLFPAWGDCIGHCCEEQEQPSIEKATEV